MVAARRHLAPALCAFLALAASFGPALVDARRLLQDAETKASPPPPSLFVDWNSVYRTTIGANANETSSILASVGPIVASALGAANGITRGLGVGDAGVSASLSGANSITGYSLDAASNITQAVTQRNIVVNEATTPVLDRMINAAYATESQFSPPSPSPSPSPSTSTTAPVATVTTNSVPETSSPVTTTFATPAVTASPSPVSTTRSFVSSSGVNQEVSATSSPVIITDISGLGR